MRFHQDFVESLNPVENRHLFSIVNIYNRDPKSKPAPNRVKKLLFWYYNSQLGKSDYYSWKLYNFNKLLHFRFILYPRTSFYGHDIWF